MRVNKNLTTKAVVDLLILQINALCRGNCGYCPFHIGDDYHMFCLKSALERISKELENNDEYSYFDEEADY